MANATRSVPCVTRAAVVGLLCCLFSSCSWHPGKDINQQLGALLHGAGRDPVKVEIDGQQKRAVITDVTSLRYLAQALASAHAAGSSRGTLVYEAIFVFADAQTASCRISPYANLDGMQVLVMWHEFDDDEVKYDVPFRGEVPRELHRVLKNLATFEQTELTPTPGKTK